MCGGKQETTGRVENDTRAGGMAVWRIVNAIFPPGKDMWKHVPNKLCSFCLYRAKDGFKEGRPRRKGQGLRGTLSHAESFAPPHTRTDFADTYVITGIRSYVFPTPAL